MYKDFIKKIFNMCGYDLKKIKKYVISKNGYELYNFFKQDGSLDYELYKKTQIEGNKSKIDGIWATEENINFLAEYLNNNLDRINFGLCHGTRKGKEQYWFRKYLKCNVIGTELSDNAEEFLYTIQWDFHEIKNEWINSVDFIYSNSLDHSYDPEKCLNAWMKCIRQNGICIIEHSSNDHHASKLDPFGASILYMPYLITVWGKGRFSVKELIHAPTMPTSANVDYLYFIIVQKH